MTKEPDKHIWETNYNNKSISGIEVRDKNGKVVHFIAIHHNEALHGIKSHRVTIRLDENGRPLLPTPQTFDEIIQAKRRQQMLLYGSGATSSSTTNSGTAARRAAAATKRAKANLNRRSVASIPISQPPSSSAKRSVPSSDSNKRNQKKSTKKSKAPSRPRPTPTKVPTENTLTESFQCEETLANSSFDTQTSTTSDQVSIMEVAPSSSTTKPIVTSMKDLNKNNPLLDSMDPKEVKQMVRSALPGTCLVLPNGTVIRKSRRGGARAGAGRKRSRPLPTGQTNSRNSTQNGASTQSASTESSPNKLLN